MVFPPWPAIFFDEAHLEAKEGPPQSEEAIFWTINKKPTNMLPNLEKSSQGTSSHMVMAFPFLRLLTSPAAVGSLPPKGHVSKAPSGAFHHRPVAPTLAVVVKVPSQQLSTSRQKPM